MGNNQTDSGVDAGRLFLGTASSATRWRRPILESSARSAGARSSIDAARCRRSLRQRFSRTVGRLALTSAAWSIGKDETADIRSMLRETQHKTLGVLRDIGVFRLCSESRWRRSRLPILSYHGVSMHDEHQWNPMLYLSLEAFEQRLALLKAARYTVLPLSEAIARLYLRTLPPRSVCITFDGGMYDFAARAAPLLGRYGFPATVYLSADHCEFSRPIFELAIEYMIWRRCTDLLDARPVTGARTVWDLSTEKGRAAASEGLMAYANDQRLDLAERDGFAASVAQHLGFDYCQFVATRRLQALNPCDIAALSGKGFEFELRLQRRKLLAEDDFRVEMRRDRERIRQYTGRVPQHLCYPAGLYRPELLKWLVAEDVRSATTSVVGVAAPKSHPLRLPRLVDNARVTAIEFEAWLTGVSSILPYRSRPLAQSLA